MIQSDDFSASAHDKKHESQLLEDAEKKIAALEKENAALKAQLNSSVDKAFWLESLKDPIVVLGLDGRCIHANPTAAYFWKNKVEKVENITFFKMFEDERTVKLPPLDQIIAGKLKYSVESHLSGSWFLHQLVPIKDETGNYTRLLVHSRDITEHKYIQEEAERFILLVENSNDLISLSDKEGNLSYINKAGVRLLGLESLQHFKGLAIKNLVIPEHGVPTLEEVNEKLAQDGIWRGEVRFMNVQTGESVPFDATCFYIFNQLTQQPSQIATVCRNLSTYKTAQEKLQNSLKEKEALLSEVHHRVKNNLAVISALLTLQSLHMEDAQVQSFVEDIKHRIRAMALIHERLYQSDSFSKISMQEYIAELADYLHTSFKKEGQEINIVLEIEELYFDITTSVPLGLMVSELITNAFKYAYEGQNTGTLTIALTTAQDGYLLVVTDDGKGLAQESKSSNTGFGIMLVHSLAQQLEGRFVQEEVIKGCKCSVFFKEIYLKTASAAGHKS